jgi:hypothetical protein
LATGATASVIKTAISHGCIVLLTGEVWSMKRLGWILLLAASFGFWVWGDLPLASLCDMRESRHQKTQAYISFIVLVGMTFGRGPLAAARGICQSKV